MQDLLRHTCIVVPAYNERQVIGRVLQELTSLSAIVVVVDDGSTDDTYGHCEPYGVVLMRHAINLGQGAALQTGITFALRELEPRFVVTFDADGQHRADDIRHLVAALADGQYDVVLGTRFARPEDMALIPWKRGMMLRAAVLFTRLSARLSVTDTHNGMRAFTAEAASHLSLHHAGMAHASEILTIVRRDHLRWCEVPVTVDYNQYCLDKGQKNTGAFNIIWDLVTGRLR